MTKEHQKGIEHISHTTAENLVTSTFMGLLMGGVSKDGFRIDRSATGALIFTAGAFLGTSTETLVGFLIYHNEGAAVGMVAGTSMLSSIGALGGFIISGINILALDYSAMLNTISTTHIVTLYGALLGASADIIYNSFTYSEQLSPSVLLNDYNSAILNNTLNLAPYYADTD